MSDILDLTALVLALGLLGLRAHPRTRCWAPRGLRHASPAGPPAAAPARGEERRLAPAGR
ncbi:hypothetical protein ACI79P_00350 [Blastococcus sp. SYSU DS0510]